MNDPRATPYELVGGEDGVRRLVDRFYDLMDTTPDVSGIRDMHPPDLETSREKLRLFLMGWLGGPPVYLERFGHPMLRARHLPFAIASSERDQWMWCMEKALDEHDMPEPVRHALRQRFRAMADHMRNREDQGGGTPDDRSVSSIHRATGTEHDDRHHE